MGGAGGWRRRVAPPGELQDGIGTNKKGNGRDSIVKFQLIGWQRKGIGVKLSTRLGAGCIRRLELHPAAIKLD